MIYLNNDILFSHVEIKFRYEYIDKTWINVLDRWQSNEKSTAHQSIQWQLLIFSFKTPLCR